MGKAFERIVIVMLENTTAQDVLMNAYMNNLRQQGVYLGNSYGVTHSSQPNYIAAVAGDVMGFCNDDPGYAQWVYEPDAPPVTCIADLLQAQGLSWKNYVEDLPAGYVAAAATGLTQNPVVIPPDEGNFARKHAPFLSFRQLIQSPNAASLIVDSSQFETDLAAGTLPNYSWYTPNLINDGHTLVAGQQELPNRQANINNIASFLEEFLGPDPIAKFPPSTLIVLTFDEAYPYYDPYLVYTLLIGDMLTAWKGTTRFGAYNHFSLLRSVEENFGVGGLKRNDAVVNPYWFLRES